jgi:hypothetical protein
MFSLFRTGHILSYFEMKFFRCTTYKITWVYELFHIFLTPESATYNYGVHPQLVAEYQLSTTSASYAYKDFPRRTVHACAKQRGGGPRSQESGVQTIDTKTDGEHCTWLVAITSQTETS